MEKKITVKGSPTKHYEDFLINDANNFYESKREANRKIDRLTVLYIMISGFIIAASILLFSLNLRNFKIKVTYSVFIAIFASVYVLGIIIYATIIQFIKIKAIYINLINHIRFYFYNKYDMTKKVEDLYYHKISFFRKRGIEFAQVIIFVVIHFIIGTGLGYFLLKQFASISNEALTICLSGIINLFFLYMYYFWFKSSISSVDYSSPLA